MNEGVWLSGEVTKKAVATKGEVFNCGERVLGSEARGGGILDLLARKTFYSGNRSQSIGVAGLY